MLRFNRHCYIFSRILCVFFNLIFKLHVYSDPLKFNYKHIRNMDKFLKEKYNGVLFMFYTSSNAVIIILRHNNRLKKQPMR